MRTVKFTNKQARQFILLKQGLMGKHKFIQESGVCDYIKQVGCIQFDPIDICGKNAELVLQSRVKGFSKETLYDLLYKDRKLIDYFDKNMSIFSIDDWRYFSRTRISYHIYGRSMEKVNVASGKIRSILKEKEFVSSKDINLNEKVDWSWNPTSLSRAALETMYFRGELILHHKKGSIKHYALAREYISEQILNAGDPNITLEEHLEWRVLRRIGSVGMLWNKTSDAFLGIDGLKAANRNLIFEKLFKADRIIRILIENISECFYCLSSDIQLIDLVLCNEEFESRTEFIAALDNMIWDRKLIKEIFDFDYKWEIYTPIVKRKYSYYVLPILFGDKFIGRIEIINDRKLKQLIVKNIWYEDYIDNPERFKDNIYECLKRFSEFNQCESIKIEC